MFSPASTDHTWTPALPAVSADAGREAGGEQAGLALGPHPVPQGCATCGWDDPRGGARPSQIGSSLKKAPCGFSAGCDRSGEGAAGPRAAGRGSSRCAGGGRLAPSAAPPCSAPRGVCDEITQPCCSTDSARHPQELQKPE